MKAAGEPLTPDTHGAADVIRQLRLAPLPHEGGWYRRITDAPPAGGPASSLSVIHALFTPEHFSALHRVDAHELWCFHAGDPLELLQLQPDGQGTWQTLGLAVAAGQQPHVVVPAGTWQGARVAPRGRWTLVSCAVVPAFTWDAFRLGEREALVAAYPEFATAVRDLTRAPGFTPRLSV